jgi:hypothetical protein
MRELLGKDHEWDLANQLRAAEVDVLRIANWQRTKDAEKGKNPPDPIPRPGVAPPRKQYTAVSMEEMRQRLERRKAN